MLLTSKTKKLALCAMLTALSVLFLYLGAVIPAGQLTATAMAALLPAAAVMYCGLGWGFGLWAATGALALLVCPGKETAVAYSLVLGHYPMIKSLIERLDKLWLEWLLKLTLFYGLLFAFYFLFRSLFFAFVQPPAKLIAVFFILCGAAFCVYDIAFSRLIALFVQRVGKYIK